MATAEVELTVKLSDNATSALLELVNQCGAFREAVRSGSVVSMLSSIDTIERSIEKVAALSGEDLLAAKAGKHHAG